MAVELEPWCTHERIVNVIRQDGLDELAAALHVNRGDERADPHTPAETRWKSLQEPARRGQNADARTRSQWHRAVGVVRDE
jgi:hypothetical protein